LRTVPRARPLIAAVCVAALAIAVVAVGRHVLLHDADPRGGFHRGEIAGHRCGGSVACVGERAQTVPSDELDAYYDGAARTLRWRAHPTDDQVTAISTLIPDRYRPILLSGLVAHVSRRNDGDPAVVVPFAEGLADLPEIERLNGVRVGLQESRGGDLTAAIEMALDYPAAYQPALLEELGWRAGARTFGLTPPGRQVRRVTRLLESVPVEIRPEFVHGACRAAGIPGASYPSHPPLLEALDPAHQPACLQAAAWNLVEASVAPERAAEVLAAFPDPAWREQAEAAYATFTAPDRVHGEHGIWEILDAPGP